MRFLPVLLLILAPGVYPQAPAGESPAMERARKEVERIRVLVDAGAAPRVTLEKAETELAEAQDEVILSESLYGKASVDDLTNDQAAEMVRAAERQQQRQEARLAEARVLVEQGVKPRSALTTLEEELERRRRTVELANSRVRLLEELARMVEVEEEADEALAEEPRPGSGRVAERYDGDGSFSDNDFKRVNTAFERRFGKPLPVSAMGMTALHRALGFDHRGRVDVAVSPDNDEGVWLRRYLEGQRIPYFAFRAAVRGKATGAHIHIGPPSLRLAAAPARTPAARVRRTSIAPPRQATPVSSFRAAE